MLDTLRDAFLQLLYPAHGPGCGQNVSQQGQWCPACWNRLWHPRKLNHSQGIQFLVGIRYLYDRNACAKEKGTASVTGLVIASGAL